MYSVPNPSASTYSSLCHTSVENIGSWSAAYWYMVFVVDCSVYEHTPVAYDIILTHVLAQSSPDTPTSESI